MTMQVKKSRIDRLATEPAFYYRTLRESIEQLDSVKAAFQWLLAAYEKTMDPAIRQAYEETRTEQRKEQLRAVGQNSAQPTDPNNTILMAPRGEGRVEIAGVNPQWSATSDHREMTTPNHHQSAGSIDPLTPSQEQVIDLTQVHPGPQTIIGAEKQPEAVKTQSTAFELPQLKLRWTTSGIQKQAVGDGITNDAETLNQPAKAEYNGEQCVKDIRTYLGLSSESLLEAKRMKARSKVALEVNRMLRENGISFTDEELVDYMENRMSKTDLRAVAQRVEEAPAQVVVPGEEFPITQVGSAQKILYADNGLLSRLLSPRISKYGKGTLEQTANLTEALEIDKDTLDIGRKAKIGLWEIITPASFSHGIMLLLEPRTAQYPGDWWAFLPLFSPDATTPPTIYVIEEALQWEGASWKSLGSLDTPIMSDLTNRIVHAVVKLTHLYIQPTESKNLDEKSTDDFPVTVLPADSKEYPQDHALGKLQAKFYSQGGFLSDMLGPDLIHGGRGSLNQVQYHASFAHRNTNRGDAFQLSGHSQSGVYATQNGMRGVLIVPVGLDKQRSKFEFWLPLRHGAFQTMPSLYVSTDATSTFYNFDNFLSTERNAFCELLIEGLKQFIKTINDEAHNKKINELNKKSWTADEIAKLTYAHLKSM